MLLLYTREAERLREALRDVLGWDFRRRPRPARWLADL